jgi:predicted metal-binding protein
MKGYSSRAFLSDYTAIADSKWWRKLTDTNKIQPVGCLWTCDRACVVSIISLGKPTYLFTNLPTYESAIALLEFSKLYSSHKTGNIPWKQFPEALQKVSIAKIPSVG